LKVAGAGWRYCRAAFHDNGKIKSDAVIVGSDKHEQKHPEGAYYLANAGQWIPAGDDALQAQRQRQKRVSLAECERLSGRPSVQSSGVVPTYGKTPLAVASEKYFSNLEARGVDPRGRHSHAHPIMGYSKTSRSQMKCVQMY
jgi:hypothetical protein